MSPGAQTCFGAMLSFEIASGTEGVRRFVEAVRSIHLGGIRLAAIESLVAHPATMTHASMSAEARLAAGISDNLVRLSIGLESEADLLADLTCGLDAT